MKRCEEEPRAATAFQRVLSVISESEGWAILKRIDFRYIFAYAVGMERARKTRRLKSAAEMGMRLQDISLEKMEAVFSRPEYRRGGKLTEWVEWRFQELAEFRLGPSVEKLTSAGICRETLGFGMGFVWVSRILDYCLKDLFGDRRLRMRDATALKRAVEVLKRMSGAIPNKAEVKGLPSFEATARSLETYP